MQLTKYIKFINLFLQEVKNVHTGLKIYTLLKFVFFRTNFIRQKIWLTLYQFIYQIAELIHMFSPNDTSKDVMF